MARTIPQRLKSWYNQVSPFYSGAGKLVSGKLTPEEAAQLTTDWVNLAPKAAAQVGLGALQPVFGDYVFNTIDKHTPYVNDMLGQGAKGVNTLLNDHYAPNGIFGYYSPTIDNVVMPILGNDAYVDALYKTTGEAPGVDSLRTEAVDLNTTLDDLNAAISKTSGQGYEWWDALSEPDKEAILKEIYADEDGYYNVDSILNDLKDISENLSTPFGSDLPLTFDAAREQAGNDTALYDRYYGKGGLKDLATEAYNSQLTALEDVLNTAEASHSSTIAELDALKNTFTNDFNNALSAQNDSYNRAATGLLSNQYKTNAQTFDTLQSDLHKSRQNALEAGASAGVRIAGNVNALLSAQNKQSQTAMDTSNALAEMLLQQRSAAAGLRSDYHKSMQENTNSRISADNALNKARSDNALGKSSALGDYNTALSGISTGYNTAVDNLAQNIYNTSEKDFAAKEKAWEDPYLKSNNPFAPYAQNYYRNK